MKLITFTESSRTRIGLLQGEQIVDLSQAAPALPDDMLTLLEAGDTALQEAAKHADAATHFAACLLYTSPSPRDVEESRMPSSA